MYLVAGVENVVVERWHGPTRLWHAAAVVEPPKGESRAGSSNTRSVHGPR